jgi:hypothetical protein
MRTLWGLRGGVAVGAVFALLATVWTLDSVSLFPPRLEPRSLEMATASTQVVVDTPFSAILDLRQDTYSIEGLRNRAVLLGNVMASAPVRAIIARRTGVPAEVLQVAAPRTAEQPRAVIGTGTNRRTTDILRSNDQYRLSIQANPTVPVLDVYAQAPDARAAEDLANAAVDALQVHLSALARSSGTPGKDRVRLVQLGRARGAVINGSVNWQAALLAFGLTFAVACATVVFVARVREGWRLAAAAEPTLAD